MFSRYYYYHDVLTSEFGVSITNNSSLSDVTTIGDEMFAIKTPSLEIRTTWEPTTLARINPNFQIY